MSVLKVNGSIRLGQLTSAPANPVNGQFYYNASTDSFHFYENGAFRDISIEAMVAHLSGSASQHDANEIDYERIDGSKKNVQAASDDVESAVTDLDDAIGALAASPTNYTPTDAGIVADHLAAIDSALGSVSSDASGVTYTPSVLANWDGSADPGNTDDALDQLAARAAANATAIGTKADSSTVTEIDANVDDLITLSGVAENASDLGTFTGVTIADTSTNKAALQALETATELRALDADVTKKDGSVAFTADQSMGSNKLTNLADPTSAQDAATKAYVDSVSAGLDPKGSVAVATTANISLSGEQTLDGVLTSTSRVLVKNQTDPTENGIYVSAAGAWARSTDMDGTPTSEVSAGNFTFVEGGTTQADSGWVVQGSGELSLGVDDIDWTQFSGAGQIIAGDGLDKAGNTLSVDTSVIRTDGANDFTAEQSMGSNKLTELANGIFTFDAVNRGQLNGKIANVSEDSTPTLGGNLDTDGNALLHNTDGVKRGNTASPTNLVEEEYIDAISLIASQTGTAITDLTFVHSVHEGMEVVYKLKEATTNNVRIGTLRIVTNGTDVVLNDVSTETNDLGVEFFAAVSAGNIIISYNSDTNAVTMRADVKRIRA